MFKLLPLNRRLIDMRQLKIYLFVHCLALLGFFFQPEDAWPVVLILHALTIGCGISVGFHRLIAHRSFTTPDWLKYIFATFGTMAIQGGPISWSAAHRAHHSHTDKRGDPHSSQKGFFWSHIWWAVHKGPNGFRYRLQEAAPDLCKDRYLMFLERHWFWGNIVLCGLTALAFGWVVALWAFPVRIVIGWHCTFFVNSAAHNVAKAKAGVPSSKNLLWLTLLTYGEGWHANHHRSPRSPNFQEKWYQIDPGFYFIWALSKLGLAKYRERRSPIPVTT